METDNARFLENDEISGSEKTRVVNFEEIKIDVPTFDPDRKIVIPQTIPQAEGNEQHNENPSPPHASPLHEDTTIENIVEPPQPAVLSRSQRERKPAIPDDYMVYLQEFDFDIRINQDPVSFSQAINSDDSTKWANAIKEDL